MANDVILRDTYGNPQTMRATDNAGVKSAHHVIETLEAGIPTPVSSVAPLPVCSAMAQVAMGNVAGHKYVNVYGRNFDIDTASVPEDLWNGGGAYTGFPTTGSAETLSVVSSSASDAAAGTGARTVKITGLDSSYAEITETITLNGTTPVTTTATFWRVLTAEVLTAGSGNFNAGTITANHSTTTANIFFVMPIDRNRSNIAVYTVPVGYTAVLRDFGVWIRSANTAVYADGEIWVRKYGAAPQLRHPWTANNTTPMGLSFVGGIVLPEKTDIAIRVASASANNMDIVGAFDLELIAD